MSSETFKEFLDKINAQIEQARLEAERRAAKAVDHPLRRKIDKKQPPNSDTDTK